MLQYHHQSDQPALERRHSRRQRILKSAKLKPQGKNLVYDCVARDMSDTGARIRIPSPHTLPDKFSFFLGDSVSGKPANIVWFHGEELGLVFATD